MEDQIKRFIQGVDRDQATLLPKFCALRRHHGSFDAFFYRRVIWSAVEASTLCSRSVEYEARQ